MYFKTAYTKLTRQEKFEMAKELEVSKPYLDAIASGRFIASKAMRYMITAKTGLDFTSKESKK